MERPDIISGEIIPIIQDTGAVAGLFCGPGAPLCEPITVTIGVFVGGVLGALGADYTFDFFSWKAK